MLRDLLPAAARAAVYKALVAINAVGAILVLFPDVVPFDVPKALGVIAAIAGAAGFSLAAGNTGSTVKPADPEV